jgi:hypothetical protein
MRRLPLERRARLAVGLAINVAGAVLLVSQALGSIGT